jgi:predicted acyltransferase
VRGLAIVIMLLSMNPGTPADRPLHLGHPEWHGLTFADLFFPLFLFVVGVSMTLSARALGPGHVLWRASILCTLGILLATLRYQEPAYTGVLQHIAISYLLAAAVLHAPRRWQLPLAAAIVAGMWAAFVTGAAGDDPWAKGGTLAHDVEATLNVGAVEVELVDGFTTEGPLQAVASTVTVLAGAFTGRLLQQIRDRRELARTLAVRAAGLIALGLALGLVVPISKRLWTPSFTVLTIGTSLAWLAVGMWLLDVKRIRRPFEPLIHIGTNPIVIYVGFMAIHSLMGGNDARPPRFAPFGSYTIGFLVYAVSWTVLWWLFARALYRRRIFVKI